LENNNPGVYLKALTSAVHKRRRRGENNNNIDDPGTQQLRFRKKEERSLPLGLMVRGLS
jgi:hypothetical protein